ncbi:hypothetical protein Tco_1506857 [Tanacetum coccineum]
MMNLNRLDPDRPHLGMANYQNCSHGQTVTFRFLLPVFSFETALKKERKKVEEISVWAIVCGLRRKDTTNVIKVMLVLDIDVIALKVLKGTLIFQIAETIDVLIEKVTLEMARKVDQVVLHPNQALLEAKKDVDIWEVPLGAVGLSGVGW